MATFTYEKKGTHLDDSDRLDLCCRSLQKCDAFKRIELNSRSEWNVQHCECVHSFRTCLKNLNSIPSNELSFLHSMNTSKCYAKENPIIKCVKKETYSISQIQFLQFIDSIQHRKYVDRCSKYELDQSQPKKLQLFDLPLSSYLEMSETTGMLVCCLTNKIYKYLVLLTFLETNSIFQLFGRLFDCTIF